MTRLSSLLLLTVVSVFAASSASAHVPPGEYGSLAAGFSHPLFGIDHVLAMIAVGLWAGVLGGRARWIVPAAFVLVMVAGFGLALFQVPLPAVEPMILASTIVLGLVVAVAVKIDVRLCAALVGFFAVFHGHAHGAELGTAGALEFGIGFALATAALHSVGFGIGMLVERLSTRFGAQGGFVTRGLGLATAIAGAGLALT